MIMLLHANEDTAVRVAYCSIHSFFDCYTLHDATQLLEAAIATACSNRCWTKEAPCNLLFYMRHLEDLCTAVFIIHDEGGSRRAAVLPVPDTGLPDIGQEQHFVNRRLQGTSWECFPRHLTSKQYHDPFKVFKKFVQAMPESQWRKALQAILEFALSSSSLDGAYTFYEIFKIRKRLLQLIEACHLIEVRLAIKHS